MDETLVRLRLRRPAAWADAARCGRLYAGKLRRGLPQYPTHFGLTPFAPGARDIPHDVGEPMPIASVLDIYQSEDVFEHLPYESIPAVFDHIHDALKPGGLFRLSLPDYRTDIYRNRCVLDGNTIVFDPGGGGRLIDGSVEGGGHLWFPTFESVTAAIRQSKFECYDILEGYAPDGGRIMKPVDYALGYIQRTSTHDPRVRDDPRPLSIIIDMVK